MKKRILSMLLAIVMVCSLLPTVAFAAENAGVEVREPESRPTIIATKPS